MQFLVESRRVRIRKLNRDKVQKKNHMNVKTNKILMKSVDAWLKSKSMYTQEESILARARKRTDKQRKEKMGPSPRYLRREKYELVLKAPVPVLI